MFSKGACQQHHPNFLALILATAGVTLAAPPTHGAADSEVALAEVIVTAQRRPERLEDVPMTVDFLSGSTLEDAHVDRTVEALQLLPGVSIETFGTTNQSNVFIRGIGTELEDGGVEQSVAIYVDGVYIGAQQAFNATLYDADRIEVLRGPQGTLYGKNALGGAIKFESTPPGPNLGGDLQVGVGNLDYQEVRGTVNAPFDDGHVLTRLSFAGQTRDGIIRNEYPGVKDLGTTDNFGLREQIELIPTSDWNITLSGDWGHDRPTINKGPPDMVWTRTIDQPRVYTEDRTVWGASLNVVHEAERFTFTSLTGYRNMSIDTPNIGALTEAPYLTTQTIRFNEVTEELRLSSPTAQQRLQWTLGVYYYHDYSTYDVPYTLVTLAPVYGYPDNYTETSDATLGSNSYAAFGDLTYALNDYWHASLGLRYSDEYKNLEYQHSSSVSDAEFQTFIDNLYGPGSGLTPDEFRFAPLQQHSDQLRNNDVSPRFVLAYQPVPRLNLYASAAKGFKSGAFNSLFVASQTQFAFGPETAWSYELGMKSAWLDNRLALNVATYYVDWKNEQVRSFIPQGPSFQLVITNAANSTSRGIDLTVSGAATRNLNLSLAYSYIDATFKNFATSPFGDLTGNRLPLVPRHSGVAMADYSAPIDAQASVNLHADFSYRSYAYSDDQNSEEFRIEPRALFNASAGFTMGRWETRLWGRNLFDRHYKTHEALNPDGLTVNIGEPRTFGIQFIAKFGK